MSHLFQKQLWIDREHSSLLDNIYLNEHSIVRSSGVIVHDLSDHFPIFASLSFKHGSQYKTETKRVFDSSKLSELNVFQNIQAMSQEDSN